MCWFGFSARVYHGAVVGPQHADNSSPKAGAQYGVADLSEGLKQAIAIW
jgi:hypothetical protein